MEYKEHSSAFLAIAIGMSDSDSDLGPAAPPQAAAAKKRRVLDGEGVLLEQVIAARALKLVIMTGFE
jgi:hypothetical protein